MNPFQVKGLVLPTIKLKIYEWFEEPNKPNIFRIIMEFDILN